VRKRITAETRALISVDVFGQPAAVEDLAAIAEQHGLLWVQDACESLGAERDGKRSARYGKAAVVAFVPEIEATRGEGGVVVTDDEEYADVLRSLRNQGRDDGTWMNHVRLGYNYRLDEMNAALGLSQLQRLEDILRRREQVACWYTERLCKLDVVEVPFVARSTTNMSWFVYVIRLSRLIDRCALMARLEGLGIPTRPYFVPVHLQPLYQKRLGYHQEMYPVTEEVAATTLALPFFTTMTEGQVEYVCTRLARCIRENI
jgi:dTDP-4-amino-4,6-dideoxygalactose transaminase